MSDQPGQARGAGPLHNRRDEHEVLARLVAGVRAGQSRALVLRGEPGVGKSVLLDHLAGLGARCRVVRVAGVQTEMELAFAGLYQLCAPMLDRLDGLPAPRREALRIAFGLAEGPAPDRFLIGLAVLSLVSEATPDEPLLCIIDDHQWLDRASAQALGFAARRVLRRTVPAGLVFASREVDEELEGLPELHVTGLRDKDARELLDSALNAPLDERVRDQIVAETRGNPLALLELPRGLTPAQLAGGFGLPAPLSNRIEQSFLQQLEALPAETRQLLQLAAADPSGDLSLVLRAAACLGISLQAAGPARAADLVEFSARVRFRHPLLRSAAYRSASSRERQVIHLALADATDAEADPDRRAWHRAQAADGPDEELAADLEGSAARARARGGLAAAAAFLQRAALLSIDPNLRSERLLAAAQANLEAGAFDAALDLLAVADAGALTKLQAARVDLIRAQLSFASGRIREAPSALFAAARALEDLDPALARETYLSAWMAALFVGRLATGADLREVSQAARRLPLPTQEAGVADLLLDALTVLVTEAPAAAAHALRRLADAPPIMAGGDDELRWAWFIQAAISPLWDFDSWYATLTRLVGAARDAGALDRLPIMLAVLGTASTWAGDFAASTALIAESDMYCEATSTRVAPFIAVLLAALRGEHDTAAPMIESAIADATAAGEGNAVAHAHWSAAILYNGLGRYELALASAVEAARDAPGLYASLWVLPELIEAAVRTGKLEPAREALDRLAESTQAAATDFGLGIEARSRALLGSRDEAEPWYREAITRLARTPLRPELARAHLVYGEWLRRGGRRVDARAELRVAHTMLSEIGCEAFAERARRELLATGERARKRTTAADSGLTAQETTVARLAVDGRTNAEIGAELFLSARTVEWHLRKIFGKLGITSRRELNGALEELGHTEPRA